jgi:hypothetical protein
MNAESLGRRLVAVLAAVVLAPLAAAPAAAATPQWERISCAAGAIEQASLDQTKDGDTYLTVAGRLDCADPKQSAAFGYAIYEEHISFGVLYESNLRAYAPVAPSRFADRKRLMHPNDGLTLCVVTDSTVRVACVEVFFSPLDHRVVVRPLPTDAPLVQRPVQVVHGEGGPRPVCGHCW